MGQLAEYFYKNKDLKS